MEEERHVSLSWYVFMTAVCLTISQSNGKHYVERDTILDLLLQGTGSTAGKETVKGQMKYTFGYVLGQCTLAQHIFDSTTSSARLISNAVLRKAVLCRSNAQLRDDPDTNLTIVEQAQQYIHSKIDELNQEGSWKHYVVGHSLGGATASCVMVALPDRLEQ